MPNRKIRLDIAACSTGDLPVRERKQGEGHGKQVPRYKNESREEEASI